MAIAIVAALAWGMDPFVFLMASNVDIG